MYTNNKRILYLFIVAVLMNLVLFMFSYFLNLPLWLDTTGTVFISCILGAPVGFLVAIVTNVFEAMFFYGTQSLFFYFVSLLTAYISGIVYRLYRTTRIKKWIIMTMLLIVVEGLSAVVITVAINGGIPSNSISQNMYYRFISGGYSKIRATAVSVLIIKIPDILVSMVVVIMAIRLTPNKLKTTDYIILGKIGGDNED